MAIPSTCLPSKSKPASRWQRLSVVGLVAIFLVACENTPNPPEVRNDSTQTLTLYYVVGESSLGAATERELTVLRPGHRYSERGECIRQDLVLRTEDGDEFARRPGPLCRDDGPWIITDQGG